MLTMENSQTCAEAKRGFILLLLQRFVDNMQEACSHKTQELQEIVNTKNRTMYLNSQSITHLYTAYRSLPALARICRTFHPIATDPQVINLRAVWPFNRPIAAFARQATLGKTWHIDILKACSAEYKPGYRGRARDEIKHDLDQMPLKSWPEDVQETIDQDPTQV